MTLFFADNIDGEIVVLSDEESKHLVAVLRAKVGYKINLSNGKGVMCVAEVEKIDVKGCVVRIVERIESYNVRNYNLTMAVAPTKNVDRFEWFVEKATEIGVDRIVPMLCEHSERKVLRRDRCEKVVVSAAKQSYKAFLPQMDEMVEFEEFIKTIPDSVKGRYIAHCDETDEKKELRDIVRTSVKEIGFDNSVVLIGPEGDFSDEEVELAHRCGFVSVWLGRQRLRTETAALYATTVFAVEYL